MSAPNAGAATSAAARIRNSFAIEPSRRSGLSALIKDHLAGGASRLAALLLPHMFPTRYPTVHKPHGGGPALRSSRRFHRGPYGADCAPWGGVRAPRSAIWSLFSVDRPLAIVGLTAALCT